MRSNQHSSGKWLSIAATTTIGCLCFAYAAIAYQSARAAAAMPFAVGAFDERHFWWPVGLGICFFLAAIVLATKW